MSTPEGKVKARLKRRLKEELGADMYMFWPVQMGLGATTLDCLLGHKGWFYSIETKAPGAKLTPRQEQCRDEMVRAGIPVFVVDDYQSIELTIDIIKHAH